ncbi:MAG: NAD(P)H-hydrate dehydratase [Planctomycetota bacterium]
MAFRSEPAPPPPRAADAHKASVGRVLIVGGSRGMAGAPALAAYGALRAGAGLVRVAVPACVHDIVAGWQRETMVVPLPDEDGTLGLAARTGIDGARAQAEVTVLGMGMGRSASTATLVRALAKVGSAHLVFDADALHALGPRVGHLDGGTRFVLTPHEGEAAHLLGVGVEHVRSDRERAARLLAERTGATIVLKGPHTLVTDGTHHWRAGPGHPVLATGGTGDVLAGVIGAFLASAVRSEANAFDAIGAAVHVHALAGERRAREGVDRGVLASEIADEIPHALAAWRSESSA